MAAAPDQGKFLREMLARIGALGIDYATPKIPSRALRADLHVNIQDDTHGELAIDYFWARFVHDGRRPFSMPPGSYLVWFRNPQEDPRLDQGVTPRTRDKLRHLTAAQFAEGLQRNKEAVKAGLPPPMVVRREIFKATPARPFFSNEAGGGMNGFAAHVQNELSLFVREELRGLIGEDVLSGPTLVVKVKL